MHTVALPLLAPQTSGAVVGNAKGEIWTMQNGYSLPTTPNSMGELGARLNAHPDLVEEAEAALRIGVHWSTSVKPPAEHEVAQVYASAVPVAYAKSTTSKAWEPFARLVLEAPQGTSGPRAPAARSKGRRGCGRATTRLSARRGRAPGRTESAPHFSGEESLAIGD